MLLAAGLFIPATAWVAENEPVLKYRTYAQMEVGGAPAHAEPAEVGPEEVSASAGEAPSESEADQAGIAGSEAVSSIDESDVADEDGEAPARLPFSLQYFGIFNGPSLRDMGNYQPTSPSSSQTKHPIELRNYATLGYNVSDHVMVSATVPWVLRPVAGQQILPMDAYLRVGYNGLINTGEVNLYADLRLHLPTTKVSRANDLKTGLQTFLAFTYTPSYAEGLMLGLYGSVRYNVYGNKGIGNDAIYYLAPAASYQLTSTVALSLLYEMEASHTFGHKPLQIDGDGGDLEPGVTWEITNSLWINPYLMIQTGRPIDGSSTGVGMTLGWNIL